MRKILFVMCLLMAVSSASYAKEYGTGEFTGSIETLGDLSVSNDATVNRDLYVVGTITGGGLTSYDYISESTPPDVVTIDAGLSISNSLTIGSTAFVVDAANPSSIKVGIGTATPAYTLDVKGSSYFANTMYVPSQLKYGGDDTTYIYLSSTSAAFYVDGLVLSVDSWNISRTQYESTVGNYNQDTDFIVNSVPDWNAFFVEGSSGNVGIGTRTPEALFHLTQSGVHTHTPLLNISTLTNDAVIYVTNDGNIWNGNKHTRSFLRN